MSGYILSVLYVTALLIGYGVITLVFLTVALIFGLLAYDLVSRGINALRRPRVTRDTE
jgi:hypothetical protein